MLTKRIIVCLDVRDGVVVKGVRFKDHVSLGDPVEMAKFYRDQGADEIVFYDITASADDRRVSHEWIERVAGSIDIPLCVAGGIRTVEDARIILNAGADKVSINSPALRRPDLVKELAAEFGTQCVTVGIDSRKIDDRYVCFLNTGVVEKTERSSWPTLEWASEVERLGAGEIVLNCMDQDGTGEGYDIEHLQSLRSRVRIPIIASGGARTVGHFFRVFTEAAVDGALAAGAFHRRELMIPELKRQLGEQGVRVRR